MARVARQREGSEPLFRLAPEFMADFNARFAQAPHNAFDAHRPLLASEELDEVLTWQETRQVSAALTVNYQRRLYLLQETERARALAGKAITVVESRDGSVQLRVGARSFPFREFEKDEARITRCSNAPALLGRCPVS